MQDSHNVRGGRRRLQTSSGRVSKVFINSVVAAEFLKWPRSIDQCGVRKTRRGTTFQNCERSGILTKPSQLFGNCRHGIWGNPHAVLQVAEAVPVQPTHKGRTQMMMLHRQVENDLSPPPIPGATPKCFRIASTERGDSTCFGQARYPAGLLLLSQHELLGFQVMHALQQTVAVQPLFIVGRVFASIGKQDMIQTVQHQGQDFLCRDSVLVQPCHAATLTNSFLLVQKIIYNTGSCEPLL